MNALKREFGWLVLLAAIWGGSFLFMRIAAPAFGPLPLIALRVGLAAAVLLPVLCWRGLLPTWRAHWRAVAVVGIFFTAFPFSLIAWAQLSLPAGMASVLNATTPLMTALWAWPLAGERLTSGRAAGLGLGLAGVAVLLLAHGARFDLHAAAPVLAMLGATASYGWAGHMARRWLPGMPPLVTSCGGLASAALLMLPLAWWTWPSAAIPVRAWLALGLLALLCTALAYLIFYRLINHLGATAASGVTYLVPVFGILWGALFLGEPVGWPMLLGAALILGGVLLLGWRR
ncbi:DMT family transporter [Chromobacterium sp. IIBBL 290-4]|uniref:DMT family transporter n=1 Tax=Chromobacterium sp. IIBBL 290-4 TaxID=2953890 RepID=UPI0020B68218|nr:DMT family transporter [Chromobacterium sp. IIBBL 290-4]UTH75893.1 DMT family transporter [Chromobacterium sp. IIBBL 290-4]